MTSTLFIQGVFLPRILGVIWLTLTTLAILPFCPTPIRLFFSKWLDRIIDPCVNFYVRRHIEDYYLPEEKI